MQGLIITDTEIKIATDVELINASLERLVFAELGTIIGSLDKGSRVLDYFYDAAVDKTALGILGEIRDLVGAFEPRIALDVIAVDITPSETTVGVVCYMKWHFVNTPTKQNETLMTKVYVVS